VAFWQVLEADALVSANKAKELQGRLKEVASGLDETSNAVIMLVMTN